MMPLRERIVRKAKERAVEHLHEITASYFKSSNNNNSNQSSPASNDATLNKTTKRANRSSYKPFSEQNQQSDDEQSDGGGGEIETPTKKVTRTRRKNPASTLKDKQSTTTVGKSSSSKQLTFRNDTHHQPAGAGGGGGGVDPNTSDSSLFSQILNGQVSMQSIVDDWIETYKKNKDTAMLELLQFIVKSSGCKAAYLLNNKEILKTKEFTDTINELIENYNDDEEAGRNAGAGGGQSTNPTGLILSGGEAYPFVQTSLQARRYKSNFCEFLLLLINQCQYSIIYDQFMMDILITFLIGLADSQVRAFRHTATLAVLKIMTGLVDVLLALSVAKDACQRQYENERQKSQMKRANDRIEMLINKRKEIEENEYEIQNFINFIFKAVFIHRYRDVCAEIRCVCINEIGEWMNRCPVKFLEDTFLKYIGWTLYDKVPECRLKCLQALQPLYEQEDLLSKLELFTSRFKNRIVEMSLDKDYDVSVSAIKLLTTIIKHNDGALEDRDCENLYELVYHTNRQIAQAAGEFLNQKLFVKVENPPVEFKKGKKQSENSTFIQLLVQFLIESELHDHPAYLVDAMWDIHPMLKDWECMTDLLLEDPVDPQDVMDDTHERYSVEIMTCCVKQAATGEYPIARRTQANRKLTVKETKQVQDDKVELTQHFIVTLPNLLTKYIADAEKLVYLLQIPSYFDLSQYTLRRQEKSLEKLLKILQEIVNKHNDWEVLEECSRCLSYLCDEDNSIYIKCNLIRSTILDELVNTFNNAMQRFEELNEVDENEMYPLIIALKRLAAFAENHNIVNYDLVKNSFTILRWAIYNEGFSAEFVNKALNLSRSIVTWNLYKLNMEMEERCVAISQNGGDIDDANNKISPVNTELIDTVSKLSKKYYKICNKLFVHDNPEIEEEAYFELCDLLVLFNIHLANTHKEYKNLILECSTNDINMLSVYVMNNVFTPEALTEKPDSSERIERLHKRRCILSSFCKLICYNCVPIKYAAEIFRGYIKYAAPYGDIIKHLLSSCRDISKVNTAKTIVLALQREFNEVMLNSMANKTVTDESTVAPNRIDRTSPEFVSLKELARRFCLTFGPEASVKSREAIVTIHQETIRYVNEPPTSGTTSTTSQAPTNISFFDVIVEFSSRLTPQDKKSVLIELDKAFAKRANKIEENNWLPYYSYRLSLMEDGASSSSSTSASASSQSISLPNQNSVINTTNLNGNNTTNNNNNNTNNVTTNTTTIASHTTATATTTSIAKILAANQNSNQTNLEQTTTTATTGGTATNKDSNQFPAPSAIPNGSSTINEILTSSTKPNQRKRKKNHSIDISGIAVLKDTIIGDKTKQTGKLGDQDETNGENDYDETENLEHTDKDLNDLNSHAESTSNDLASLKLSTINHIEASTLRGGRVTRSANLYAMNKANIELNKLNHQNKMVGLNVNNKRSRSPLVANNSINESTDQVLTSTRIEAVTKRVQKNPVKSSISIRPLIRNNLNAENNNKNNNNNIDTTETNNDNHNHNSDNDDVNDVDNNDDADHDNDDNDIDTDLMPLNKRSRQNTNDNQVTNATTNTAASTATITNNNNNEDNLINDANTTNSNSNTNNSNNIIKTNTNSVLTVS